MCGSPIYLDGAGLCLAFDHVGFEARAVGDVVDLHLLKRDKIRPGHQGAIDGNAAFIMHVGRSHRCPMDLGRQDRHQYWLGR